MTNIFLIVLFDSLKDVMDDREQNKLGAHLIKLYPWLKDEMEKSEVLCIAFRLLMKSDRDFPEAIESCGKRRAAVDKLLKLVLRKKCYIQKFFSILNQHWNPTDLIDDMMKKNEPNDNEIAGMFESSVSVQLKV